MRVLSMTTHQTVCKGNMYVSVPCSSVVTP